VNSQEPVFRLTLGHVSREKILRMASLSGDFHPFHTLPTAAKATGSGKLLLHPCWISGLAAAGVRLAAPAAQVLALTVEHDAHATEADILTLELVIGELNGESGEQAMSFRVVEQRGRAVAHGTARVRLSPNVD
jgi:acyl dehydratase